MLIGALALAGAVAANAQSPAPPSLAPGEVLLQIIVDGEDRRPADDVSVLIPVNASGATSAEARAANLAKLNKLTAGLVAAGIDRSAIAQLPNDGRMGFVSNGIDPEEMAAFAPGAARPARRFANALVKVKLANIRQIGTIQPVLDDQDLVVGGSPVVSLRNDQAARAAAIANGIYQARKDATAQADALGLRIVRFVRSANYGVNSEQDYATLLTRMMDQRDTGTGNVVTRVKVAVDYVAVLAK